MDKIISAFSAAPTAGDKRNDNFTDRLSNRYTVVVLVASCALVSAAMYVGSAITCWAPKHFTGSHTKYANSYCWVRNTYYVPWTEQIPREGDDRRVVPYYQWIPFILITQAVLFYIPKIVWNGLNQKVGVDADDILNNADKFSSAEKEGRKGDLLSLISNQLHRCLTRQAGRYYRGFRCNVKDIAVMICNPCGTKYGNYLSILYIVTKILYVVNVMGQLFLLNRVLATDYDVYGIEVLGYVMRGEDWTEAPHVAFPRVTFCDIEVRRLGNVHRYTLQCLLPINMYTEKIYMMLWFWFVFVAAMTLLDLVFWVGRYFSRTEKVNFVTRHLSFVRQDKDREAHREEIGEFVDTYLKHDGAFLLRLIGQNTNTVTVTDITVEMWDRWREWKDQAKRSSIAAEDESGSQHDSIPSTSTGSDMKKEPIEDVPLMGSNV